MNLVEIFTSPYAAARWNWDIKDPMMWSGHFEIDGVTYKVEIDGVPYKVVKKSMEPKEVRKVLDEKLEDDDILYNARFGILKDRDGSKFMSTTPSGTGNAFVVLTTVSHMIREFAFHNAPKAICFWPAIPKLKNIYKRVIEKVFTSWNIMPAKYAVFDGFVIFN